MSPSQVRQSSGSGGGCCDKREDDPASCESDRELLFQVEKRNDLLRRLFCYVLRLEWNSISRLYNIPAYLSGHLQFLIGMLSANLASSNRTHCHLRLLPVALQSSTLIREEENFIWAQLMKPWENDRWFSCLQLTRKLRFLCQSKPRQTLLRSHWISVWNHLHPIIKYAT